MPHRLGLDEGADAAKARVRGPVGLDGDAIFGLSTSTAAIPDERMINALLAAAADCTAAAIGHGMLAANSAGSMVSFRDLAAR